MTEINLNQKFIDNHNNHSSAASVLSAVYEWTRLVNFLVMNYQGEENNQKSYEGGMKKELLSRLQQHLLWIESNGSQGACLDLSGHDLQGTNFRRRNLSRAMLRDVDMSHCDCREANLDGADLSGAELRQADFSGSTLRGADLTAASMEAARFHKADLCAAKLMSCDLTSTDFFAAVMIKACLRGSTCFETTFFEADLSDADLSYMAVYRTGIDAAASLHNADLSGIDLKGSYPPSARKLLQARTLYDIRNMKIAELHEYSQLTPEEKNQLQQLWDTPLD